jgi:hypothetical protein
MNSRSTAILAAVAVVVLGIGVYVGTADREQQAEVPAAQTAFPGLAAKLAGATAIEVSQAGSTLHLARKGDGWTVPDKGGYPAKNASVHELLASLAGLRLAEARTANPDDYAKLGVADPAKEASKEPGTGAMLVRVQDGGGATLAEILVGHTRFGSNGSGDRVYVRRPGDAQAWLSDGPLKVEADPAQWVETDIANIAADKITSVTVTRDGQTLSFARKDGTLAMTAPAEHPPLEQYKVDDIGRALQGLMFDDVKPAPAPGKPEGQAVFTTSDGMTITASVSKDGQNAWFEFAASGDDKAKDAVAAFEARVKGWAYQVGTWKEAAFVPTLDQLKASPPPGAPAKPAAGPAAIPVPAETPAAK